MNTKMPRSFRQGAKFAYDVGSPDVFPVDLTKLLLSALIGQVRSFLRENGPNPQLLRGSQNRTPCALLNHTVFMRDHPISAQVNKRKGSYRISAH